MQRITDLSIAQPNSAWTDADANIHKPISNKPEGGWRLIDYICGDIKGQALQTSCADSQEITIPIALQGWHAISIAMAGHYDQSVIEIKFNNESRWQTLRAGHGDIQEIPWRFADLKNQSIQIRYPKDSTQLPGRIRGQATTARIFWIRLESIATEHIQQLQTPETRPLIYLNDGHSLFWWDAEKADKSSVEKSIQRFANTEWQTCCFCNGGADLVNYPSKYGTRFGELGWDDPNPRNHKTANIIQSLIDQDIDVLKLAADTTKRQSHKFWFYLRPQAWVGEPPFDHAFRSRFFVEHPEFRCMNLEGKALGKLSYAYPEVRQHINNIIKEALDRGAEAIGIATVRACPLFYFEPPVIERFEQEFGQGKHPNSPDDPRIHSIWNTLLYEWLEEIRDLFEGNQRLFLITGDNKSWNQGYGIDLKHLSQKGLIDDVLLYPLGEEDSDVTEIKNWLGENNTCRLLPGLGNFLDHGKSVADIQKRAINYYEQGADGLNRWDTSGHLIGLELDSPGILKLWHQHYLGEQDLHLDEFAGLYLNDHPPLDGF